MDNYYILIPSNVRYNDKICPNAKLLYGEITSNDYLEGSFKITPKIYALLFKVDLSTIRKWLKSLRNEGLIKYVTNKSKPSELKIYLTDN